MPTTMTSNNNNKDITETIHGLNKPPDERDNKVTTDNNSNERLRESPSSQTSSTPSSPDSPDTSPPTRPSITVKTDLYVRSSHVFFAICCIFAAIAPFYIYDSPEEFISSVNSFFFPPILKAGSSNINYKSQDSKNLDLKNGNSKQGSKLKTEESLKQSAHRMSSGGWRSAEPEIIEKYDSGICNIPKFSVADLTLDRFEKEFRYKKPVIITFPNGAAAWTQPAKWSRAGLRQEYSQWTVQSGSALEIVRKGGNGDQSSSFTQFLDTLQDSSTSAKSADGGSGSYVFDRSFFFQSSLPGTLKLPEYFTARETEDESIFFLGASLSGVVFHKHSDTWNGIVFGRKRWFLYPSKDTPPGGNYVGFSVLDWINKIYSKLPESDKPTECVQEAGEIFYLPEGWYHATLNLGDTIAFAIQKKIPVLETEILFYEATDLVNQLQGDSTLTPENKAIHSRLLEIYTELHILLPESSEVLLKVGEELHNLERYADSLDWYQKAIDKDPNFVMALVYKGKSYSKLREYEQAEDLFQKAMELSPNLWDIYKEYGEFLLRQGRHADALPVFKKGTELMPNTIPFWFFYQLCQKTVGDLEGAEASAKVIADLKSRLSQE